MLDLDILSFNGLAEIAMRIHNRRVIEEATTMRVAFNADQKQWKEWSNHYSEKTAEQKITLPGDAEALIKMLNTGRA